MSKYTPEVTSGGYTGRIVDENGNTVAIVNNYDQALLMASAPELLEALEWTARALDKEHPAAIKARVAIAKAKGEHP